MRVSGRVTFSSTWNPPRKRTRQIRHNCVRKCLVNASTQAGLSLRKKKNLGGAKKCAVLHGTASPSLNIPLASNSAVRRESLRLYFVARAFGYAANVLLLRPFLPAVNISISQPTAARVGAMSPMRLLRFHDGGSQDRMGYPQVVHFRHLQTADFISKLTHSVQSRMLYPNSVIA